MALTTQSMTGEIQMKGEEAGAPEGYEFVKDEEGRMSIRKIRKAEKPVEKKVEKKVVKKAVKKATKKKFSRK